jgi:hypothetical protein
MTLGAGNAVLGNWSSGELGMTNVIEQLDLENQHLN